MSLYPVTKQWSDYPYGISPKFPFHIKLVDRLGRHFSAHRHDFLELSLVLDGDGYQMIDGERYPMSRGTLMFLLPYQIQEMITLSKESLRLYNCMFDLNFLSLPGGGKKGLEKLLFEDELPPAIQLSGPELEAISGLLAELTLEYEQGEIWREQRIQAKLWDLLIRFDRLRRQNCANRHRNLLHENHSASSASIWSVIRYVHLHYAEPVTLAELSQVFGMSGPFWSKQFKKHLGLNFIDFLHEVRIRHACSLLVSTDMSVLDIAVEVGCGSLRSFLRAFQQLKQTTPTEYRRCNRPG